jgi:hypothetical protein
VGVPVEEGFEERAGLELVYGSAIPFLRAVEGSIECGRRVYKSSMFVWRVFES